MDHSFMGSNRVKLDLIQDIIKEYRDNRLVLTLRQVHYQLVSKNLIENNDKEYRSLSNLLANARLAGVIDWNSIVDRNRESRIPYYENDITDSIERTLRCYRLDRMKNQDVYIEVMIEKMAIYEIVKQVTDAYSITLTGNKGNCSVTVLYDCANRLKKACAEGKYCIILYIGDHDPSGLMMIDSICNQLSLMCVPNFEFRPIALTQEQALQYNLPVNPVKMSDKNSPNYIEKYGKAAWECDALPTKVMQDILRMEILSCIDCDKYQDMLDQEENEKKELSEIIKSWRINN
jgi:hypothetical protein